MPRAPMPEPKTCTEAAERLTYNFMGDYSPRAGAMRDVAFVLKAFGETPVPQPILDRYEWSRIGERS